MAGREVDTMARSPEALPRRQSERHDAITILEEKEQHGKRPTTGAPRSRFPGPYYASGSAEGEYGGTHAHIR